MEIARNLEVKEWREHKVVCMFVAMIEVKNHIPLVSDLVDMLKMHGAY